MKDVYDVAIIGSGPAGLAAAIEVAKHGCKKVVILDENFRPGGQLFKQIHKFFGSKEQYAGIRGFVIGETLMNEAKDLGVEILLRTSVMGLFNSNYSVKTIGIYSHDKGVREIKAKRIVIATGARENVIAFPGWTLPGVMGAGAAQTLMNIYRVLPGEHVLMIGSGNVGLIVTYQLLQAGAKVVGIVEAMPKVGGWGVHAAKILRMGVPIFLSHTIKEAIGKEYVEKAVIWEIDRNWKPIKGTEKVFEVDLICLAVGMIPNIELTRMAGCEHIYIKALGGWVPLHNMGMETTVKGVYVAGDVAGVEENSVAIEEGRLAGISCAEALGLIDSKEAVEYKDTIWKRLDELRSGPFGEHRKKAKYLILQEYEKRMKT